MAQQKENQTAKNHLQQVEQDNQKSADTKKSDDTKKKRQEVLERTEKQIELEMGNAKDSIDDVKKYIEKYGIQYTISTQSELIIEEELRYTIFSNLHLVCDNYRQLKKEVSRYIGEFRDDLLKYEMPRWSNPIRNAVDSIELEAKRRLLTKLENIWKQL